MGLRGPLDSRISVETRPVVISRTIRVGLPVTATVTLLLQASIGPDHWTGTREPTGVVTASADSWMLTSVGCRMIQPETRNVRVLQGTCSAVTHAPERARTAVLYCKLPHPRRPDLAGPVPGSPEVGNRLEFSTTRALLKKKCEFSGII